MMNERQLQIIEEKGEVILPILFRKSVDFVLTLLSSVGLMQPFCVW